jgi:hypothetical protein
VICVSHPSRLAFSSAEQLLQPLLQAMLQVPPEQAGAPFTVLHGVPHAPQLRVSVCVLTSQPFAWFPSQFWKPGRQVNWQAPSEQIVPVMLGGALAEQL